MSFLLPDIPDPALRQPATLATVAPVFLGFYAQAVLAILPKTFILKLALLPFIVWQAWSCAVGLNFSMALAKSLGLQNTARLEFWNIWFVSAMLVVALRSFEWTFVIEEPLRKYEWPEGQGTPVERSLSVPNVLLDAFDLLFNMRGIGWSWSSRQFPRESTPQPSIVSALAKILMKFMLLDTLHHILHRISPTVVKIGGGSLFDATAPFFSHTLTVLLATFVTGLLQCTRLDLTYHIAMLIGRILLRQPASSWPPLFRRPWMATSLRDFWSVHWHQCWRHIFVVFGARPGGALLGRPGAVIGAFAMSGFVHIAGVWGIGCKTEFLYDVGFFVIMGVGAILEGAFQGATRLPVRGFSGWLWTMGWTLSWGSFIIDSWARRGFLAADSASDHLRPGKLLINGAISLFSK